MSRLQILFIIGFLSMTCDAFWWGSSSSGRSDNSNSNSNTPRSEGSTPVLPQIPPALRQYPISYIRAFAYHPVAFPQPLAPITTYTVRGQPNPSIRSLTQQQLPNLGPQDFGTPPTTPSTTTTTTTTTTTPPPTTQAPFTPSQQFPQFSARGDFGQRQLNPFQAGYQNYGGYPYYYNQQYHYRYDDQPQTQFSGRISLGEPQFQQYSVDPVTYQFIPTSITPIQPQNSVKFVPCMCPVAVQVSPPLNVVKERTNESEIPVLSQSSTEINTSPATSSEEESIEEAK